MKETKFRSLTKTIIWRVIATLITWLVIYIFTKEISQSLIITVIAALVSMLAYYIHERIWNNIKWGKL